MRSVGPYGWLWLLGVIASGGAAVSLWFGAEHAPDRDRPGYRWLAAAALLWCVGAAGQQILSGQMNGIAAPLTLADLFPLLALAPMVAGIVTLAAPPATAADTPATPEAASTGPIPRISGPIPTVGNIVGAVGNTVSSTAGSGAGSTVGSTVGSTADSIAGNTVSSTAGTSAGSTVGSGAANTAGATTGSAAANTSGATTGSAAANTAGDTAGTAAASDVTVEPRGPAASSAALAFSRSPQQETQQFWGYLADSYVMAAALFVVGWLAIFGAQYHRTGEDPRTFLLGLFRPLAGILVVSALLPIVAAAGRRAVLPYLALIAVAMGDAFGAALRLAGGHEPGGAEQIAKIVGYLLLAAAPWVASYWVAGGGRAERAGTPTGRLPTAAIVSALAVAAAAVLIIANEVTGSIRVDPVVVFAASGAVVALAIRVLGLLRENGLAVAAARASGGHVRELADRTSDVVLICDLDGTIRYSSPSVGAYGYATGNIEGRNLAEFVHPEDRPAGQREIRRIAGERNSADDDRSHGGHGGRDVGGRDGSGSDVGGRGDAGRGDAGSNGHGGANGDGGADDSGDTHEDSHGDGRADDDTDAGVEPGTARFPCRVLAADGTWRHIEATVSRYTQPGERGQLLFTARDVSDQVALRQQVTHLTFHDRLTGLPNRVYFEERVVDVLGRRVDEGHREHGRHPGGTAQAGHSEHAGASGESGESQAPSSARAAGDPPEDLSGDLTGVQVAAVFLHLDGFTAVNDSVGHAAGDLLVTQAARRLRDVVPAQHTLARWGDGEFAILVEARAGAKEIVDLAEQLARCISAEPFSVSGRNVALTASVGVALAGDSTAGDVMRNADVAMSRARSLGGGRVEIFAAHMHADIVRRLELTSDLQRAVTEERLAVEFQPIVELATSRVTGVEALVRWWRCGEPVPPVEFLGIAEESGLIVPIGDWVLHEACGQLAQWRRSSWDIGVSVNFSQRQIGAPGFVESVLAALADAELPASALTIEVAEQVLEAQRGETAQRLSELRRNGVRIAIDDFGTGYASLGNLRQLPVDIIKVDPSFVSGVGTDETLTLLTYTIVRLGHDLGLTVVAEGIERPRQLEMLREMGCARGQGYLVARPMAAPGVESMIRTSVAGYGPDVTEQGKEPAPAS